MYSVARDQTLQRYAAHVIPAANPCSFQFCVVSRKTPSPAVAQALQNSAPALGYDENGYFCVVVSPDEGDTTRTLEPADMPECAPAAKPARTLEPADLFRIIEGIDPFAVVVAEEEAAVLVEEAYRASNNPVAPDEPHDSPALGNSNSLAEPGKANSPAQPGKASGRNRSSEPASNASEAFSVPRNAHLHLLGRDTVVFSSFEAMLASPNAKQRAWALLKKLKR